MLVISTDPGISTVDARVKGFEDAVKADSTFKYLGVQYSHNDPATAAQLVSAALQKDPDIVGIFATNLFSAEGSATGIKQAGKAGPGQDRRLRRRTQPGQGAQGGHRPGSGRPAAGARSASTASTPPSHALDGTSVPQTVQTGFTVITKDNVDGDGADAIYKSKLLTARHHLVGRGGPVDPQVAPSRTPTRKSTEEGHP